MKTPVIGVLCATQLALVVACTRQERAHDRKDEPARSTGPDRNPVASPQEATPESASKAPAGAIQARGRALATARVLDEAPPPRLYDEPVERRLHSSRIEASSFLWTDWNRFQENYHPSYIMDGDPKTAWVEGADSSGKGEWVRIHVSPVEGASKIRLRIRNGYHKSQSLHAKNARARKLAVKLLPGGHSHTADLADDMSWQEIAFDHPPARIDAIELEVLDVFEGKKYTDLCISDVEVYVTGLTVENPAFEKAKLDELLAWKKERLAAARLFASAEAAELPILSGYRVEPGEAAPSVAQDRGENSGARATLQALRQVAGSALPDAIAERVSAALAADLEGWVPVRVVARSPLEIPAVDGLRAGEGEELIYSAPEDAFLVPAFEGGLLLRSDHLSTFDVKGADPRGRFDCEEGRSEFLRPPRGAEDGPLVRELALVSCVEEDTREGKATYAVWQLLAFDDQGYLALMTTAGGDVISFTWEPRGSVRTLVGGLRARWPGQPIERLLDGRTVTAR
ncbi:MAG TPA: hypothetical protein VNM90_26380 [Haliangium sp.]|nr:hypothetical protein [Haliangium sp.]